MCWVTSSSLDRTENMIIFSSFYVIPVVGLGILVVFCYTRIYFTLKKIPQRLLSANNMKAFKFLWYPAGFIIAFLPAEIDTISFLITDQSNLTLLYFHLIFCHSLGFINSLVYGALKVGQGHADSEGASLSQSINPDNKRSMADSESEQDIEINDDEIDFSSQD